MRYSSSIIFFFSLIIWFSCTNDAPKKKIPDTSHIQIELTIKRFEQDLFAIDTNNLEAGLQTLEQKYPVFYPLYAQEIVQDKSRPIPAVDALRDFLTVPVIRHLNDTVQIVYGDLTWLQKDLEQMFKLQKHYLPKVVTPQVVTMVSEFANDAFTYGDSLCGIGLDMFLGENYPGYDPNFFPGFLRRQFQKDYITTRLAKAIAQNQVGEPTGERLLDLMIHNGKVLYLVDCLVPLTPDSIKMGYTQEQMLGCYANEQNVWARILDQNLLYSAEWKDIRKLVSPSPNAPMVYLEAPGEIGNWIGLRIVEAYMKRHPNTSMEDLFALRDAQAFLEEAKYRPGR